MRGGGRDGRVLSAETAKAFSAVGERCVGVAGLPEAEAEGGIVDVDVEGAGAGADFTAAAAEGTFVGVRAALAVGGALCSGRAGAGVEEEVAAALFRAEATACRIGEVVDGSGRRDVGGAVCVGRFVSVVVGVGVSEGEGGGG